MASTKLASHSLTVAALALLGALAGCGESFNIDFDDCEEDTDCGPGQVCVDGFLGNDCVTPCTCDSECEGDELCVAPSLVDPEGQTVCKEACRGDVDCEPGEICKVTRCEEGCREDADCPAGEACVSGLVCEPGCRDDAECAEGNLCHEGECVAGCREPGDCPEGETCLRSSDRPGTCGEGCEDEDDCVGAEVCVCGTCAEVCESDADCESGESCPVAAHECAAATCQSAGSVECGGEACPELRGGLEGEISPCCIQGDEPRCGFASLVRLAGCGELLPEGAIDDCGCGDGRCCTEDGRCGDVVYAIDPGTAIRLCVPDPLAADPACVPAD